ncbi:hypothetical protein V565_073280 [Rhizoctonia solani 123E]|uniref:HNH nuclease domain-containing protein n=1 Tax=Rhizoctonia solani 123E TaxID=1423351 RepID=A0A074S1Q1_9AGAM|nr:hypothetical protein V565_073280 [Rhizoctonia solani 123E]
MNTAVPLPPLQGLFEGDAETSNAYARLLPLEDQAVLPVRILGQMLIQAPSLKGRTYVARSINCCATNQAILKLGESQLGQFIQYFEQLRTPSSTPLFWSIDELQVDPTASLIRDNYRCMLSGFVDNDAFVSLPALQAEVIATKGNVSITECHHILTEYTGCPQSKCGSRSHNWTIGCLFGTPIEDRPAGPGSHDLRNILTLEKGFQACFERFMIWLEPTAESDNQYTLMRQAESICRQLPSLFTFTSTSPDLPLPDPQYLAIHAACARIIKLAGAAHFITKFVDEADEIEALEKRGPPGELVRNLRILLANISTRPVPTRD